MYTIYCHIFPNCKRYIGLTKNSLNQRWDNGNSYKTCPLVNRAIKKYGWDNVQHEILCVVDTKEEAEHKEKEFIEKYNTTDNKNGYNILPGGDVATNIPTEEMRYKLGSGWRGKHRTQEEKDKIGDGVRKTFSRPESNGHIGLKVTDETKAKMSKSQKESWNNEYRRKVASDKMRERMANIEYKQKVISALSAHKRKKGEWSMSEDTKKKLSKAMKGRWIGDKSPTSKPVLQYTKQREFIKRWANAGEVERAGIAKRRNIAKCCNHYPHYLTAGGYIWEFEKNVP